MKRMSVWTVLSVVLLTGVIGCSSQTRVESDLGIDGPDWVNEGSQALDSDEGRLLHGVGSAPLMGDMSLQKATADNRARAEVARILSSYMTIASNDYVTSSGSGKEAMLEQTLSRQIRNFTDINLSGARIIARWRDEEAGTIYSLAELDMSQVEKSLAASREMNDGFKNYVDQHSDNVFEKLMKE